MYANKYFATERIVIGKGAPSSDLGHPNRWLNWSKSGIFLREMIPQSNNKLVMNEVSTISTGIVRRRKWRALKISPFEDMVVDEYLNGSSLSQIRQKLASCGVSAARYTILRYIDSLPQARINGTKRHQP